MQFYKTFSFKVIIRLILLLVVMVAFAKIFGDKRLFFNHIILACVLIIQIFELLRFLNQTNKELAKFILSIKHQDFSASFNRSPATHSFQQLNHAFNEIILSFKDTKMEKEGQYHYLQTVVSHINVGILSLENDTSITLMNKTAEDLLQATGIKNWKILKEKHPEFVREIDQMHISGRKLISLEGENNRTLSVEVNTMQLLDKTYKLITFQDIKNEIEQTEIEAWHKLIRILTHEIMNSATPISSLTETMLGMLTSDGEQKKLEDIDEETIGDLRFSLNTIQKRSDGMLSFIDDYRKLTKVSNPRLEEVHIQELFQDIHLLMKKQMEDNHIALHISCEVSTINLDRHLMEQVLINLITNSKHALEGIENAEIHLTAQYKMGKACIEVTDNGSGIPKVELSQIFVPFYSTKKQGSGIGLSLSKQIMHLHGGYIKVASEEGRGTCISLYFKG
ncbi:sensor histidine kinase [Fulvivirga ligni]|uniref:sensor histidine kinase n=1 Tax=Fulvivirga ligni TaxID=2904246 RepID=UPI001F18561F|nr:ATP-binding protein [Fulvivirga ligni]UII20136.1 ATP-binding protein [Fulvivirga ligni]